MVLFTEILAENFMIFDMHMGNLPKNDQFLFLKNDRLIQADNFRAHYYIINYLLARA